MTKLALTLAGAFLAAIGLHTATPESSLAVASDLELRDLYGGACGVKTAITCNGADEGCVESDCYRVDGDGTRKKTVGSGCGVFECGTVYTVTKCAVQPPDPF